MNFLVFALAAGSFTVVAGIIWLAVRISMNNIYGAMVTAITVGFVWALAITMMASALL